MMKKVPMRKGIKKEIKSKKNKNKKKISLYKKKTMKNSSSN